MTRNRKKDFLGKKFNSPFFLAASPVTSTTCIRFENGEWEYDQDELKNKIIHLLDEIKEIGAVILKSVYYPEAKRENKELPNTRVWMKKGGKDFYHVGHTPREMLTVEELKDFLRREEIKKVADKIIISLGVKHADIYQWEELFKNLFKENKKQILTEYDVIEINARHTLREINMIYLEDRNIDEYVINPASQSVWNIVYQWFNLLNTQGKKYKKKLLIKLPFRSDLIILCGLINRIIEENEKFGENYGIRGVTLINTIKSPTLDDSNLLLCSEEVKIQQMSGYSLKALRNWAIKTVKKKFPRIEISASGGIYDINDVLEAEALGASTFQLCSIVIRYGIYKEERKKIGISEILEMYKQNKKEVIEKIGHSKTMLASRRVCWDKDKCTRCMQCLDLFYCDAFVNKHFIKYKGKIIEINNREYFIPEKFYPRINPKYCTGCGLCIQVCGSGALYFCNYEILLATSSPRRKKLFEERITSKFVIQSPKVNEDELLKKLKKEGNSPEDIVKNIALEKARSVRCPHFKWIIAADTLIKIDDEIVGKPSNEKEAREILKKLDGKVHEVYTGLAIINTETGEEKVKCEKAKIKIEFHKNNENKIEDYIKQGKWKGKAGGYNIEEIENEELGRVEIINDENETVIGLPIEIVQQYLRIANSKPNLYILDAKNDDQKAENNNINRGR